MRRPRRTWPEHYTGSRAAGICRAAWTVFPRRNEVSHAKPVIAPSLLVGEGIFICKYCGCSLPQEERALRRTLSLVRAAAADVPAPDAPHDEPDDRHRHRHERRGRDTGVEMNAGAGDAVEHVPEQADDVIADRGDRQAFDRRLQP